MRDQSRLHSLLETLASIAIGFCVSLGITAVVLPAYGMPVTWCWLSIWKQGKSSEKTKLQQSMRGWRTP